MQNHRRGLNELELTAVKLIGPCLCACAARVFSTGYTGLNAQNATSASARTTSWWGPAPRSTTSSVSAAWPAVGSSYRATSSLCGRTDCSAGQTTTWWSAQLWPLEIRSARCTPPDRCRWQVKSGAQKCHGGGVTVWEGYIDLLGVILFYFILRLDQICLLVLRFKLIKLWSVKVKLC